MRLTLRQLDVFTAICRSGGVSHAAAAIGLSQSAASQALAELESALEGPLFDRAGRGLLLNERGRALLPRAAELLERATDIETSLRRDEGGAGTLVRLAASLTVGSYLLPQLIGTHLASQPRTRVELQVENTGAVIAAVAAFQVDAGFIEGPCEHPDLRALPWREDELCVIAPPDHPLARKRRLAPRDLAQAAWVLRERGSGTREVFDRAAESQGIHVRARLELGHTEAVMRAVMAGAGLGCLSRFVVEDALRRGELAALRTPFLELRRPLHAVVHRAKFLGRGLRGVLEACELELSSI
ncbi:MAG TPA: LysR family transcriptional regulator [Nevskia sp.]|nr:LysR family transcriptional regulator [Nevskia sp.]